MDKIKITEHQLFSLTACTAFRGTVILIATSVVGISKQDTWITPFISTAFGMLVMWMYWFLGSKYPNMTLIGIIKKILGKYIGLIVASSFVLFCLNIACHMPWYVGNFITTTAMPETPPYIINLVFVITVVIATLYGLETIARASELIIYFASFLFLTAMILVLPNAKFENLQPVLENGFVPVLKSSVFLTSLLTFPLIILMMVYPFNVDNISKAKIAIFKGYLWTAFLIFITILISILVLGTTITSKSQYPTYLLAKEIDIGTIFTRLEFIVAGSWIITIFMGGLMFFYAGVIGLAELLELKDYRKIVIPFGLIALVMSQVIFPNVSYQAIWINTVWIPYNMAYGLILPLILLLVFLIKKWLHIYFAKI